MNRGKLLRYWAKFDIFMYIFARYRRFSEKYV